MDKKYYLHGPVDYNGGVHQIWGRNVFAIRQTRFIGYDHPHDVMAIGSPEELWYMWQTPPWDSNDVDWSLREVDNG
jgi:hypothetical protein